MPSTIYDVCVIGSGAAGGIVTKTLCEAGAKVILLEAGEEVKPARFRSHCWPYDLQYRGFRNEKQELFYPGDVRTSIRYDNSDGVRVCALFESMPERPETPDQTPEVKYV